ncbi:MAG TPA: F0F1 ATP synthase subunit delta, partial [Deltaproteobacteria bacterium]|nr:F0F1 ATP synthase subunit delta [Deltaproteobacteria bacterium]
GSLAKRYATALLSVAEEQGKVDEYFAQLSVLRQSLAEHPDLQNVLSSPVLGASQKKAIFSALAPKLGTSPVMSNLMHVLIDNERINELHLIELIYRDMADER